jgi:aerotolerance regulator-like protein/VWA domain-containing protein
VTFLAPVFLIGSAAAAIPILLHLLKREPEPRLQFSAVRFLRHAPVELTAKRRLRELLLLALRVAALVLLALAFARPFFASSAALESRGATIVAIDVSYSLSAPGRIERARELAKAAIARAPAGDAVGVLTFGDVADPLAPPSADRAMAAAAVDRVDAGFGATRYQVGLNAAVQELAGRHGTIVVVTDLQESGWDAGEQVSVPSSARVEIADVGPPPPNLGVTAVRASGDRVTASVRNTGPRPRDTRVSLVLDGRPAGEMPVSIGPGASADVVFGAPARASAAEVSVVDHEGLQADNVRYAILDESARPSLLVVTATGDLGREAFYVQQALAAGAPASAGYQVAGVGGAQLSTWDAARLAGQAAVLLLSTRGLERRGREALAAFTQGGGGLVIAAGPDVDGDVIADVLGGSPLKIAASADDKPRLRMLAPADVRHPIFQPFGARAATLGLVKFQKLARIGGGQCQTLATFTTGEAAMLECAAGEGRAIVIASDLNDRWNDFPLHPTFVPFVHEVVRYASSARPRAGEYLVGDAPAGLSRAPGFATLKGAGSAGLARRVAINVDPREGDPSRLSVEEFQAAVTRLKDAGASQERLEIGRQEDRQHLWLYVFMLMLATLVVESAVASRT